MASNVSAHGRQFRLRWRLRDGSQQIFSHVDKHHVERLKLWLENVVDERDVAKEDDRILQSAYLTGAASEDSGVTLVSLCEEWLADRMSDESIGANSVRNYRARVARLGGTGRLPIQQVSEQVLKDLIGLWRSEIRPGTKRPYADNTIRETFGHVSAVLGWAHMEGKIQTNPARRIKVPKAAPKKEDKFLTVEEYGTLREYAPNPDVADVMDFMVSSGARIGEALALRCDDISHDGEYYVVRIDESFKSEYGPTKTKKTRFVDVLPEVGESLLERTGGRNPSAPVFPNPNNRDTPWSYHSFDGYWDEMVRAAQTAGITFPKGVPTPHWLRHTHAAWLLMSNHCSMYELSTRLGHASIVITVDMYGHIEPQARKRVMNALLFVESRRIGQLAVPKLLAG